MQLTEERQEEKYAEEFQVADSSGLTMFVEFTREKDGWAACEFVQYIVWLGANAIEVEPRKLAVLALAGIEKGMWWGEVAEDLGLPVPGEWE